MRTRFDDFCLWVYVVVDDIYQTLEPQLRRPGPQPACRDSERIAICLIGACRGWHVETESLSPMQAHRDTFPILPEQSRFNRRRRQLMDVINMIRQRIATQMPLAQDPHCGIDSLPIPAVQFHLAPRARGDWGAQGADFGRISSKKATIFGSNLHLLTTAGGLILDFALAPANVVDLAGAREFLPQHRNRSVIGDKAYISADAAAELWCRHRIRLLTIPRRNQKRQLPKSAPRLYNSTRQLIEMVISQLVAQFAIQTNHALSVWGLRARLCAKLPAHTLCLYLNHLMGVQNPLQIKRLTFSNSHKARLGISVLLAQERRVVYRLDRNG